MSLSCEMTVVLKRSTRLFLFFWGAVLVTAALAYGLDLAGTDFEKNSAFWALVLLLWPSVVVRRGLDDAPQEGYIYLSSIGVLDILALVTLYFLVCLELAWLWTALRNHANGTKEA